MKKSYLLLNFHHHHTIILFMLSNLILTTKCDIIMQKQWAYLNITISYNTSSQVKNVLLTDSAIYGLNSPIEIVSGQVVIVNSLSNSINLSSSLSSSSNQFDDTKSSGCSKYINQNLPVNYIALVSRGECTFETKIQVATDNKASAIIIYNSDEEMFTMLTRATKIPNVFVSYTVGNLLTTIAKSANVYLSINPGPIEIIENNSLPSKASIYFVTVAFFVVVVVTLIWIIVYYFQKYRYYNAKKRLDVGKIFIFVKLNNIYF